MKVEKKVCLLGEPGVGKTSLVRRFVYNIFSDRYLSTIGVKVSRKEIILKNFFKKPLRKVEVGLMVWDLVGQGGFQSVQQKAYQGTNGAILVGDLSRPHSFEKLQHFADALRQEAPAARLLFLANKGDLVSELSSDISEMLDELVRKYDTEYLSTSAKTGEGVEEAFRNLGYLVTSDFFS